MKLYYKDIKGSSYKELNLDDEYDINNILIKIVSDFPIMEVEFEDEIFANKKINTENYPKEIVIHKLRSNTKAFSSFSIKYIESIYTKSKKFNLNISEKSKLYDIGKIKTLDEMYKVTKDIVKNDFHDSFSSLYTSDLKDEFNTKEYKEKLRLLNIILKMIFEISKDLKVELIRDEELRDSSEVKVISATSAKYFIVHSEDWYREGNLMPKPIRLLTDVYEENKDIYENRFIRFVIFRSILFIKQEVSKLENILNIYEQELLRKDSEKELEGVDVDQISKEVKILNVNVKKVSDILGEFNSRSDKFSVLDKKFKEVKLIKSLSPRMTQKMSYDNRYKIAYKTYKELKEKFFGDDIYDKLKSTEKTYYKYRAVVINTMVDAFKELQFTKLEVDTYEDEGQLFIESNKGIISGSTAQEEYRFEIEVDDLEGNDGNEIILKLFDMYGERKEINFKIDMGFVFKIEKDIKVNIKSLYKESDNEKNTITILLESFKEIESDILDVRDIFKIANLGNNFVSNADYENFGDYKRGTILFSLADYVISKNKFKNLFFDNLAKLSFGDFCLRCSSNTIEKLDEQLYLCKTCGIRIAINKCECGEKIVKVLSKENENIQDKVIDSIEEIKEYHIKYDLQSNFLGSCYGDLHSNSGGFCAKCGKCLKKTKGDCLRCNLLLNE